MGDTRKNDRVQLYQGGDGDWRWRRRADNNEIISTSGEGYEDEAHARRMAKELNPGIEIVGEAEETAAKQ